MEDKKLIKILLKDMGELEELIAEVKLQENIDPLEMEFVHSRAKGLLQLMQLFEAKMKKNTREPLTEAEQKKVEKVQQTIEDAEIEKNNELPAQEKTGEWEETGSKEKTALENIQETEKTEDTDTEPENQEMSASTEPPREKTEEQAEKDDDMLEEDNERTEANSRLGDSFLKGKSVNDIITDQNKLEYKLSNRPVSSIQSAIGINDRFQYIRELFDGDSEKFLETVKILDSMQDIKQAVDYLRKNFKWKKNETSLQFVNLVKRRFQNA
jgi:hypothetical protein